MSQLVLENEGVESELMQQETHPHLINFFELLSMFLLFQTSPLRIVLLSADRGVYLTHIAIEITWFCFCSYAEFSFS